MQSGIFKYVDWRAIPVAGVVAGTLFLVISAILSPMQMSASAILTLHYDGSLVLGSSALVDPGTTTLIVGVLVHYLLSILFTLLITIVIHRWGLLVGIVGGGVMGLAIYGITLYSLTLFFPWYFAINSTGLLISHVIFGAAAGGVYEIFDHYDEGIQMEVTHGA